MISMYSASVPVCVRVLGNLSGILDKGAAHADARKIDPAVLINARLFPDMYPLARQVQIATDVAKGCASRLAGQLPPGYEDTEQTFAELTARIDKTIAFLKGFEPAQIDGSEERVIELKVGGQPMKFSGLAYLQNFVLPNVYFHTSTAYGILRHNGVAIGKADYLGSI